MHCVHVGSFPSHLIFFRLETDSESGESRWGKNIPAAFTSSPDPASLDLEGLGIGKGLFADADTFLLLGSGGGGFGGHGGYEERRLVESGLIWISEVRGSHSPTTAARTTIHFVSGVRAVDVSGCKKSRGVLSWIAVFHTVNKRSRGRYRQRAISLHGPIHGSLHG